MPKTRLHGVYRASLSHLYTRQGFDRTRLFVHPDGLSFAGCPCYYCGELATCEDHAFPLIALHQIYGVADLPSTRLLVIVPACHECNTLLGEKVFDSLPRRKRYIKTRLRKRYKRILEIPSWHPQELQTLNPNFRDYVELGLFQQEALRQRLSW